MVVIVVASAVSWLGSSGTVIVITNMPNGPRIRIAVDESDIQESHKPAARFGNRLWGIADWRRCHSQVLSCNTGALIQNCLLIDTILPLVIATDESAFLH